MRNKQWFSAEPRALLEMRRKQAAAPHVYFDLMVHSGIRFQIVAAGDFGVSWTLFAHHTPAPETVAASGQAGHFGEAVLELCDAAFEQRFDEEFCHGYAQVTAQDKAEWAKAP